jgi:hypothetical protein
MTNFKQAPGNKKRGTNRVDGHCPDRRRTKAQRQAAIEEFEAAGFTWTPGPWRYTWQGEFPVFILAPGIIDNRAGLVARCAPADKEILFPYGMPATAIAARLNDEILAIMRHDADIDDAQLDWEPVVIDGQIIGPAIAF